MREKPLQKHTYSWTGIYRDKGLFMIKHRIKNIYKMVKWTNPQTRKIEKSTPQIEKFDVPYSPNGQKGCITIPQIPGRQGLVDGGQSTVLAAGL
jgi:hypothetical protein